MKANTYLLTMTELSWIQLHHLQYDLVVGENLYLIIMEAQCWIYYSHCRHLQMRAHISCSQLNPSCMWFSWPSGESGSGEGFLVGSTASAKWASNDSRSVRLRGWCTVGLSMILLSDLTWGHVAFNSNQIVAHRHLSGDSDWFRLDFHSVYHLCTSDRVILSWQSLHHDSAWMCRTSLLQSRLASLVAYHLMPAAPADARTAASVVGYGTGRHSSAPICLSASLFFLLFHVRQSLCLPLALTPSFFYLFCIDTFVKSAPLCTSLTMRCFLYLT